MLWFLYLYVRDLRVKAPLTLQLCFLKDLNFFFKKKKSTDKQTKIFFAIQGTTCRGVKIVHHIRILLFNFIKIFNVSTIYKIQRTKLINPNSRINNVAFLNQMLNSHYQKARFRKICSTQVIYSTYMIVWLKWLTRSKSNFYYGKISNHYVACYNLWPKEPENRS